MEGKDSDGTWDDIAYEDVEIGDQIGGGGFALVYKGKYKGKSVALKTLVRKTRLAILLSMLTQDTHSLILKLMIN